MEYPKCRTEAWLLSSFLIIQVVLFPCWFTTWYQSLHSALRSCVSLHYPFFLVSLSCPLSFFLGLCCLLLVSALLKMSEIVEVNPTSETESDQIVGSNGSSNTSSGHGSGELPGMHVSYRLDGKNYHQWAQLV